jgi:hypothetical protein
MACRPESAAGGEDEVLVAARAVGLTVWDEVQAAGLSERHGLPGRAHRRPG